MMRGMGLMDEAQNLKRDGENRNGSHELSRANAMSRTRADIEEFIRAMTKLGVPPGQHRYRYGSITKIGVQGWSLHLTPNGDQEPKFYAVGTDYQVYDLRAQPDAGITARFKSPKSMDESELLRPSGGFGADTQFEATLHHSGYRESLDYKLRDVLVSTVSSHLKNS